jgi:hypothetical protein
VSGMRPQYRNVAASRQLFLRVSRETAYKKYIACRHGRTSQAVQTHACLLGRGLNARELSGIASAICEGELVGRRCANRLTRSRDGRGWSQPEFAQVGIVAGGCQKSIDAPVALGTAGAAYRESRHREPRLNGMRQLRRSNGVFHVKRSVRRVAASGSARPPGSANHWARLPGSWLPALETPGEFGPASPAPRKRSSPKICKVDQPEATTLPWRPGA